MFGKKKSVIGLDIGSSDIKAIELSETSGGLSLTGFGYSKIESKDALGDTLLRYQCDPSDHDQEQGPTDGLEALVLFSFPFIMDIGDLHSCVLTARFLLFQGITKVRVLSLPFSVYHLETSLSSAEGCIEGVDSWVQRRDALTICLSPSETGEGP